MKKLISQLLFLQVFFMLGAEVCAQCNSCNMRAQDPKQPWKFSWLYIDNVSAVVKPVGKFYQVDLYMNYHLTNPENFYEGDSLEIVHYFGLSNNAAITDSWLWVDGVIMQADIYERSAAYSTYEGIVKRRKDPSILYKYQESKYEFRIYPILPKGSRKVKLSFLVASDENDQIDLPFGLFNNSLPAPTINLIHYEKDSELIPVLSNGIQFNDGTHQEYGPYKNALIKNTDYDPSDGEHSSLKFKFAQPEKEVYLSATQRTSDNKEGLFQLSVDPSQLMGLDTLEKNKYVFVLDYDSDNTLLSKSEIIEACKTQISAMVREGDSFRILYNQLAPKEITQDWLSFDDLDQLDELLQNIELGNSSILRALLYEAYDRVKDEKDGILFVMSDDSNIVKNSDALSFRDELLAHFGSLRQTLVLNFNLFNPDIGFTTYNGTTYYGNELFYKLITTLTHGSYSTMLFDSDKNKIYAHLQNLKNNRLDNLLEFVDYRITPNGGFAYEIYPIKYGNRSTQVGKYKGGYPFTLEVTAKFKDSIISNTYYVYNDTIEKDDNIYKQCQAMGKIIYLESLVASNIEHLLTIVETSLESRVLSRQTAFLALEPGMQAPCMDCEDESINTVNVEDHNIDKGIFMSAPNPFSNVVKLTLKGVENPDDVEKTELIDLTGRIISIHLDWKRGEEGLVAEFDGSDLKSGIYLFRITVKGKVYILKVVKA